MENNEEKCDGCHGTAIRLDPTCSGNVYTNADTLTKCTWCDGTGRRKIQPRKAWTRPAWYCDEVGELPDWMVSG